jgi:hypothetical protein
MTQIAQAYFHLKPFDVERDALLTYRETAREIARQLGERVFLIDTEISVALERGSLQGWITAAAIGNFLTAYGLVADYKGFKESLQEMVTDARWFGEEFNKVFLAKSHVDQSDVFRTERRTKAPGKLLRAINDLEAIELGQMDLPPNELKRRIREARIKIAEVEEELDQDDRKLINNALNDAPFPVPQIADPRPSALFRRYDLEAFAPPLIEPPTFYVLPQSDDKV